MSQQSNNNQQPRFWNWGKGLAVAITLFVITTLSVVFYMVSLDYYMVSENHYEQAVNYQQQIDRIEHARALEQAVHIRTLNNQHLEILFPDSLASVQPTGNITLYRPSNANFDRSYKLALDVEGRQLIPSAELPTGKWIVQLTWQSGNKDFFQEAAIFL